MKISRRSCGDEHLQTRQDCRHQHHDARLQALPSSKDEEQGQTHCHAEPCPEQRQVTNDGRRLFFSLGNLGHHPFSEAVVLNLLLGSLLEEVLNHDIVFIGHIRYLLNS
jgi:hypothetical protein